MNKTSIEWTHRPETGGVAGGFTWNPIRARRLDIHQDDHETKATGTFCTRISPGCTHCYASAINKRFGNGLEYTVPNLEKVEFFIDEKILLEPWKRKKPATIFVGDMFDLFHEAIPDKLIQRVLEVAIFAEQHTLQFLTKRADRMQRNVSEMLKHPGLPAPDNLWFGVSVEDQPRADERIPLLLQTPAAVRFLSVEPQLEAVSIHLPDKDCNHPSMDGVRGTSPQLWKCSLCRGFVMHEDHPTKPGFVREVPGISWVICGGESGPGARPFNLAWAESLQKQCAAAGAAFFMKQIGNNPYTHSVRKGADFQDDGVSVKIGQIEISTAGFKYRDRKGGHPAEWPEPLRVREFPQVKVREAVSA